MRLTYASGQTVEKGDHVCLGPFEAGAEGRVVCLFPKSGRAMVHFAPETGRGPSSVPVRDLALLRRAS